MWAGLWSVVLVLCTKSMGIGGVDGCNEWQTEKNNI